MATHKCRECIWSNKINNNLLFCIFPRCIIKKSAGVKKTGAVCDDTRAKKKGGLESDRFRKEASTGFKSRR